MAPSEFTTPDLPRDLGGGLRLRSAAPSDGPAMAEFNYRIHDTDDGRNPEGVARVKRLVLDLMSGRHPTFQPQDFLLVEETATGQIVSCSNLIPQAWTYEGISLPVGRPELVGTDNAYRGRGLVRAQFEVLHAWSARKGQLLQAITGIPYYYRSFGYEMALNLGGGRECFVPQQLPALAEGQREEFTLRRAQVEDAGFLLECYRRGASRWMVAAEMSEALLRFEIAGKDKHNVDRQELLVIEADGGRPAGFAGCQNFLSGGQLRVNWLEAAEGFSWQAVVPSVLRGLEAAGLQMEADTGESFDRIYLSLGEDHPAYRVVPWLLGPLRPPYAWYLRVPDLPALLRALAPALERRLEQSVCAGYSGELRLTFYQGGLRLSFDNGRLDGVESSRFDWQDAQAAYPGLTFLQSLFGFRSFSELRAAHPDLWSNREVEPLLEALFPRRISHVWPVS